MTIGIDVSQLAFPNTGVANYLKNLCLSMFDSDHEFVLFFSSLRGQLDAEFENAVKNRGNVTLKKFPLPQSFLTILWNKMHKIEIEKFIGPIDVFLTSDWTEPPSKAKKASILYDLIVYKNPEETDKMIVETQKSKHKWMKKEADILFCISKSTAKDAEELLNLPKEKLHVIYPGL